MTDHSPLCTARRKTLRKERLGNNSHCLFCGYAALESLTTVSRKWLWENGIAKARFARLLEEHHVFGQAHDAEATVTLCLNCHREITEGLAIEGVSMRPQKHFDKLIAGVLKSSAVLFELIASSYRRYARLLEDEHEP